VYCLILERFVYELCLESQCLVSFYLLLGMDCDVVYQVFEVGVAILDSVRWKKSHKHLTPRAV